MFMSSTRKTIGLTLALIGVVIAVMGLAILLDVAGSKEWTAYTLIALAVFMLIYGALVAYYLDKPKKARAPSAAPAPVAQRRTGSYEAEAAGIGEGRLADAIRFGAAKIDAKVAAGTMSEGTANVFFGKLMSYAPKIGTEEEEAACVSVAQLIGGINDSFENVKPVAGSDDAGEAHGAHAGAEDFGDGRKLIKAPKQKREKPKKVKAEKPAKPAKAEKAVAAKSVKAAPAATAGAYAVKTNVGNGKLADAIKYGAAKIDAKVAAGTMSEGTADVFYGKLMSYAPKIGTDEEEASLLPVSQLIGGINDSAENKKAAPAKAAPAKVEKTVEEKPVEKAKTVEEKPEKKEKPAKEKPVAAAAAPVAKATAGAYAAKPIKAGTGRLADAIKYGAQRIDARLGAGEIDDAAASAFFDKLVSFAPKAGTDGEEAALVSVAQVISAINRA